MNESQILVLLDIDGTLLDAAGQGRRAFYATLSHRFPGVPFPMVEMAGRTDYGLWVQLATAAPHIGTEWSFEDFAKAYAPRLEEFLTQRPPQLLPGAMELVLRLEQEPEFVAGIVTGNFQPGARAKLLGAGLAGLVAEGVLGTYGDQVPDKGPLAGHALELCELRHGHRPRAVLVGDTPEDIRCAKNAGIACLGVATGPYDKEHLLQAGADRVVQNLSNTDHCIELLREIAS